MPDYLYSDTPMNQTPDPTDGHQRPRRTRARARSNTGKATSHQAVLKLGAMVIPLYDATIRLVAGKRVTIEATVLADLIDIEALEPNTKAIIQKPSRRNRQRGNSTRTPCPHNRHPRYTILRKGA
jgi:hypothetical protein